MPADASQESGSESGCYDVYVAGAGMAGLEATTRLIKSGANTLLADLRDNVGGRTVRSRREAQRVPMTELGAFFIYDAQTAQRLRDAGAEVTEFPEDGYHVLGDGVLKPADDLFHIPSEELSAQTENISMEEFLTASPWFNGLSPDRRRIVRLLYEADFGAPLDRVGISSMLHDAQTMTKHEFFGVCTKGGFSTLARNMGDSISGDHKRFGARLESIRRTSDGGLRFQMDGKRVAENIVSARSGVLAVPYSELGSITYDDGRGTGVPLNSAVGPEAAKALSMIGSGDVVKIAVMINRPLIPGKPLAQVSLQPGEGPVRCSSVWALPPPSDGGAAPNDNRQALMLYLGGSQAVDFVEFANAHKGTSAAADAIRDYLGCNFGVARSEIIGEPQVSAWVSSQGGRTAYTFIKPGGPTAYNPRAAFKESIVPGAELYLAGEAFHDVGATLVTGALGSGDSVADAIIRNTRTETGDIALGA